MSKRAAAGYIVGVIGVVIALATLLATGTIASAQEKVVGYLSKVVIVDGHDQRRSVAVDEKGSLRVGDPRFQFLDGSVQVSQQGAVQVGNFPATQQVSGTVDVGNLPSVQEVSGTVSVDNHPSTIDIGNLPDVQDVSGTVAVAHLPSSETVLMPSERHAEFDASTSAVSVTSPEFAYEHVRGVLLILDVTAAIPVEGQEQNTYTVTTVLVPDAAGGRTHLLYQCGTMNLIALPRGHLCLIHLGAGSAGPTAGVAGPMPPRWSVRILAQNMREITFSLGAILFP